MSDAIVRLKVESQEYDQKLKRATEGLTRYADECRKVGGTLEVVEKETLDYVRALGQMGTVAKTTNGSLSEMKKAYTELSMQYRKMTDEEKKGEYGQALRQSLDQLRGRIKETEGDLKDINKELTGSSGLSGALDQVAGKFGLSIKQLTGWGAALGAGKVALDVAKDAFFQSETNIDEWGRTLKGAEGAYQVFLDTLNNGNWSNFFQNLETAIRGGRDLYDVFDRLGSIKSNNAAAIALVQQQIAALRLAKQQGKNVDDQLKAATARLAALQKQSIQAGKAAGNQSAFNVIRNGVNSIGGAHINDATIKLAVSQLMTGGQAQFDKFRNNRDILRQRGMVTRTQTITDSQGGTYQRQYKVFDINALSREQQKQYALAQAITEGETRLQAGISAFAQAVTEGTASAREEFKGNRYALQGARGGGGTGGSGGTPVPVEIKKFDPSAAATASERGVDTMPSIFGMLKDSGAVGINGAMGSIVPDLSADIEKQQTLVDELREKWAEATGELRDGYMAQLIAAEEKLRALNDEGTVSTGNGRKPFDLGKDISKEWKVGKNGQLFQQGQSLAEDGKNVAAEWQSAASAIGAVGAAMSQIEDPAAKVMGTIAQAIATIALTFASSLKGTVTPWDWIAAAAAGTATMISTISAIHSATGYAQGGIVKGNSYSGDNIGAMVDNSQLVGLNAGEVVLTKAMQNNLAGQLQGGGLQNLHLEAVVTGEHLRFILNSNGRRTGRGEYVTTNFR